MKKERILDRVYKEFEANYKDMSEEEMQKVIEAKEKEVKGKEESLESLEGEAQEKLSKDIEQSKKRLENLKGYNKNKTQIASIIKYREQLSAKLQQTITQRDESEKAWETARDNYMEATKELANKEHTEELTNDEYNDLLQKQADAEKEMDSQRETFFKSKEKVLELQTKIGKCNLAWKSLFVNKTWDDIQRISMEDNKKFTRKVKTGEKLFAKYHKDKSNKEPKVSEEDKRIEQEIGEKVSKILDGQKASSEKTSAETKALTEVKSKNPFRRLWDKIVKWVKGEEKTVTEKEKASYDEKTEKTNGERDQFLEGLRQHVDVEYRNAVKQEKDRQYREVHEVKPKEDKEETR